MQSSYGTAHKVGVRTGAGKDKEVIYGRIFWNVFIFGTTISVIGYEIGLKLKKAEKPTVQSASYSNCICNSSIGRF